MEQMVNAWEQFLRTGRVNDYLRYCRCMNMVDHDIIEGEEYPDEDEYTRGGNRLTGY